MSGDFVTCSDKVGAIRLWAASQKSHKSVHKVGVTGVRCVKGFESRPSLFLIGFKDGALGLFDIRKRKLVWQTEAGHAETIFDAKFKPSCSTILATGSFDGYVKIWDLTTMRITHTLSHHVKRPTEREAEDAKVVYSVSWAPGEDSRLATSNAAGEVIIWDYVKNKVLSRVQPGGYGQMSRVEWNQGRKELLACGASDSKAYVIKLAGDNKMEVIKKYSHGGVVYGVSWGTINK